MIFGRLRTKIQEVSEDIKKRRDFIPIPKTSFMEENTQNTEKKVKTH